MSKIFEEANIKYFRYSERIVNFFKFWCPATTVLILIVFKHVQENGLLQNNRGMQNRHISFPKFILKM